MKKLLSLICFFIIALQLSAQFEPGKSIYQNPKLAQIIATQKTVAILPFITNISYKKPPKNYDAQANKEKELNMATSIQSSMYTYLLKKGSRYSVEFQDVEKTNTLLRKAGVLNKLDELTQDEIAKILGVDATIHGKFDVLNSGSEAGAIITTVLVGASKTGSGNLIMTISDGKTGEMLWRLNKTMNQSLFSDTDMVIDRMMRKVSRNFPYSK